MKNHSVFNKLFIVGALLFLVAASLSCSFISDDIGRHATYLFSDENFSEMRVRPKTDYRSSDEYYSFLNLGERIWHDSVWMRYEIVSSEIPRSLILWFDSHWSEEAEIYLERAHSIESLGSIGTKTQFSWSRSIFRSTSHYELILAPGETAVVYGHFKSAFVYRPPMRLIALQDYELFLLWRIFALAILVGGLGSLVIYHVIIVIFTGQRQLIVYCLYHACLIPVMFFQNGGNLVFPALFNQQTALYCFGFFINISLALFLSFAQILHRFSANVGNPAQSTLSRRSHWYRLVNGLQYAVIVFSISGLFLSPRSYLLLSVAVCLLAMVLMILILDRMAHHPHSRDLQVIYAVAIIAIFLYLAPQINLLHTNFLSDHALTLGMLWESIFIAKLLGHEIKAVESARLKISETLFGDKAVVATTHSHQTVNWIESDVAILAIDIVGFSRLAMLLSPRRSFNYLRHFNQSTSAYLAKYGGLIDRALGDGVVAIFDHQGDPASSVERALIAAKTIQRHMIGNMLHPIKRFQRPMLFRIGLHFGNVGIVNLGARQRLDYSLVGPNVELAKSYEKSCNPGMILLSEAAKARLSLHDDDHQILNPVMMNLMADGSKGMFGYEYNPHARYRNRYNLALARFSRSLGYFRTDPRIAGSGIFLKTTMAKFSVVNLSLGGYAVKSDVCVGTGVRLTAQFEMHDSYAYIMEALRTALLDEIEVEVRWASFEDTNVISGLQIVGMNEGQKGFLLALLLRVVS